MTNSAELKNKLGEYTEKVENKAKEFSPHYTNLEPWKRGLILIALTLFLLFTIYQLIKKERPEPRELTEAERKKIEALVEERILKRAEFLNRLRK